MTPGDGRRRDGDGFAARVFASARAAGCRAAEIFIKTSASRQVAWEPPLASESPARTTIARAVEAGAGLVVVDREGRAGMAWRGGGPALFDAPDDAVAAGIVAAALAAASACGARGVRGAAATDAPERPAGPGKVGAPDDRYDAGALDLVDPECLDRPDAALVAMVEAAAAEVAEAAEGALEIDRILVTEARTSVRLARLDGFDAAYDRTIAALSVALVPAVARAEAVTEERSACRLGDLDPRGVARDAVLRGLPPRAAPPGAVAAPPAGSDLDLQRPRVVLAPRAAATLLAAIAPGVAGGGLSSSRRSALSIVDDAGARGRPGSAPFDGSGAPPRRLLLLDHGRAVARITPETGPFQRHSYRDLPAPGPAGLAIVPGQRRPDRHDAPAPDASARGAPTVHADVIEVRTGADFVVQVRRGTWEGGGVADGLYWEGPPAALVKAVAATLDDVAFYQVGLPVATPTVVLEGLGPWRLPGAGRQPGRDLTVVTESSTRPRPCTSG